ncbi:MULTISPECIES: M56 family metallopeptidase [unclassified Janibacter]|uniref:M56 family metallopeptidase n=1 Tax=unclassified Janibacter TaxID=2649294 RepID=UPI003D040A06
MLALALVALAATLTIIAPRVMATRTRFRESPRAALIAWQAVAFSGALSAIAAAPVAATELGPSSGGPRVAAAIIALAVSTLVLASLLVNGHLTGTRLRAARRRHRELIDLVGQDPDGEDLRRSALDARALRVVPHETPTAYCIPGIRGHVVLTAGTLTNLSDDELTAVIAHERSHLDERHDLVLEYFTVLHQAAPVGLRAPEALREVTLLIEVMADRAARRTAGDTALARALVALAGGSHPAATLGATEAGPVGTDATLARMQLLGRPPAAPWRTALVHTFSVAVVAAPFALIGLALTR